MECRACKGAINAVLNPKRTSQQLHESAVRRRIADLLLETEEQPIDIADLSGADLSLLTRQTPVANTNVDVNKGVTRYLQVREQSNLNKRIQEIKKIIRFYGLEGHLTDENRRLLGLPDQPDV
jgi:hypothetical protein